MDDAGDKQTKKVPIQGYSTGLELIKKYREKKSKTIVSLYLVF